MYERRIASCMCGCVAELLENKQHARALVPVTLIPIERFYILCVCVCYSRLYNSFDVRMEMSKTHCKVWMNLLRASRIAYSTVWESAIAAFDGFFRCSYAVDIEIRWHSICFIRIDIIGSRKVCLSLLLLLWKRFLRVAQWCIIPSFHWCINLQIKMLFRMWPKVQSQQHSHTQYA